MSFFTAFVIVVGTVVRSDDDDECSVVEEVEEPSVIRLVVLWLVLDGSNTSVVFALAWPANNARPISAYKNMFVEIHMMIIISMIIIIGI